MQFLPNKAHLVSGVRLVLTHQCSLQSAHLIGLAVHQNHVGRLQRPDEARGLLVVRMCRERDVVNLQHLN